MSTARRGRRRAAGAHAEGGHDGPDERWAVSYSDMVTVLMCLFIVLFAMSSIDKGKYDELRNSLAEGFGVPKEEVLVIDPSEGDGIVDEMFQKALEERQSMEKLRADLQNALSNAGLEAAASFNIDERGLTVGLVSTETFFVTNSTELSRKAKSVLAAIGPVLAADDHSLSIEGHADYRPTDGQRFATNWELSAGRATSVLRNLVEVRGVEATRTKAVGFGSTRPIANGKSNAALAKNRRVDIVVLSNAPEDVRALLPDVKAKSDKKDTKTSEKKSNSNH